MIPKLIHQTAKTAYIPEAWKPYQQRVQELHPGWTYHLWTDADNLNLVQQEFSWFEETYRNLPKNIMRADVIRYMLMYKYGGLYLDLDYEMLRPFDFVSEKIVVPRESKDSDPIALGNSFFASEPGDPFWLDALKDVKEQGLAKDRVILEDEVIGMTGPGLLTRVYQNGHKSRKDFCIPKQRAFNPPIPATVAEYESLKKEISVYGIHHCTGSWRALTFWQRLRAKIRRFFGKND